MDILSIITNNHKLTLQKASLPISDIAEVIPHIILSSSGRGVADQLSNDPTDNCVSAWDDRANGRPHVGDLLGHPLGQRVLRELGEGGGEEGALVGAPRVRVDDEEESGGAVALFEEHVAKMELVIPKRVAAGLEYQGGLAVPLGDKDLEIVSI